MIQIDLSNPLVSGTLVAILVGFVWKIWDFDKRLGIIESGINNMKEDSTFQRGLLLELLGSRRKKR